VSPAISTDRIDRIIGPLVASMVAGPLTALPILLRAALATFPHFDLLVRRTGLILLLSTPIGFVVSLVPNIAGTWLMVALGRRRSAARGRLAWAGAGFVGGWMTGSTSSGAPLGMASLWMGAVGVLCALICRAFVGWPDGGTRCPTRARSDIGSHGEQ